MLRSLLIIIIIIVAVAAAGCDYRAFDDCTVACTAASGCPDGFGCGSEGLCRPTGVSVSCRDVLSDAGRRDACVGLQCEVVDCAAQGKPPTSVSGTVFAPNGTLPLHGVTVYVPNSEPGPLPQGSRCDRCETELPGEPLVRTTSDASGRFKLDNVPAGSDVPVVITSGKWRRQIVVPSVGECADTALPGAMTSLPRDRNQGDLPRIAVSTGNCDALECLVRRLGIADSEFTVDTAPGRVHLYSSNGASRVADGTLMTASTMLWGSLNKLEEYDVALFSCECSQAATNKPQTAMDNIKLYADRGGRLVLTHYQNVWIDGELGVPTHAPQVWPQLVTCPDDASTGTLTASIDQTTNPDGPAFANWMVGVMGSTTLGQFTIQDRRQSCTFADPARTRRWVFAPGATELPQMFQFTTPNEAAQPARCGKVVFTDMHVASGSTSSPTVNFPGGCAATPLSPQEKALAFVLFDASACIGANE